MVRLADMARLKIEDLPKGVDHNSPLADQVTYVFTAMNQYAKANNWAPTRHGTLQGRRGAVTMTYLIKELFPNASLEERQVTQQIVSSVLRQTGAAVCLDRPSASRIHDGEKPTWYVADHMPENLVVVATHHKPSTQLPPDRLTHVANKLTPHEAGEDRSPEPVTVSRITQDTPEPSKAERDLIVNDEFIEEVFEQVATSTVPVTVPELMTLTNRPAWAARHALTRLEKAGRVFWRIESRAEKLVRGGGKLPPARPSRLWWPASPVPERTELPQGIDPVKSSHDHAVERITARAEDDQVIYEHLKPGQKHRTSGKISQETGIPIDRVKASLLRMFNAGRLRRNEKAHQYFWASSVPRSVNPPYNPPTPPKLTPELESLSSFEKSLNDSPSGDESGLVSQIKELIDQLADQTPGDEVAEMLAEIERLKDVAARLVAENAVLKAKVEQVQRLFS